MSQDTAFRKSHTSHEWQQYASSSIREPRDEFLTEEDAKRGNIPNTARRLGRTQPTGRQNGSDGKKHDRDRKQKKKPLKRKR
ncbi:uncharacterized protein FFE2_15558 [Fusarium fujikuroi]|uniref:Uncharacterized protein n=1 Tax=Fusarium fujikuroi TaxID=5127 RepID=A0A9Q9UFP5_FUSFU|nr:uncharacterized protein FFE2_15558 [Fusarium fujikuroi]VTT80391.1 unnamed protein product [Fusarium fujikuroi]